MNDKPSDILSTYRHLRLAMALLLALLLVAVVLRAWSAPPGICFEGSISAYYFTSVRAVFVAALCTLGTCLIVYRGNRDAEDIALNASGILAFVVAFVPTGVPATTEITCSASNVPGPEQLADAINNNVVAMIVVSFVAVAVALSIIKSSKEQGSKALEGSVWVFLGVLVLAGVAFALWPQRFRDSAHAIAAIGTFVGILAVVAINAYDSGIEQSLKGLRKEVLKRAPEDSVADGVPDGSRRLVIARKWYAAIWTLMVASLTVIGLGYGLVSGWRHALLWIEATLLLEFLAFWLVQTWELWSDTRRA